MDNGGWVTIVIDCMLLTMIMRQDRSRVLGACQDQRQLNLLGSRVNAARNKACLATQLARISGSVFVAP